MAYVAEDESAGIVDKPWPRGGEKWLHPESGHVVTVRWLEMMWSEFEKGDFWVHLGRIEVRAKSFIPAPSQCVFFTGDDGKMYVRTVENFLANFERVG